ncbi:alpha/beta fold hydrolase [Microterricola pindariensis]|uniref:Esterase n=1 Tax=Microterricola pindariensis TaxID=478010 RepID=A0ABX5AYH4_9MICO|nr:alpha/beta fold hydrolase [Microterricola pindariensis]PPL19595.1 esterase [Microterricola pindariensis]
MDVTPNTLPSIILVPGHWLGAWAWDAVAPELRSRGHAVTALTLPGLDPSDPDRSSRTLDDQAEALQEAVSTASADGSAVVLVAHSGAGSPVSVFLDQHPTAISRVVYVDSGPVSDGSAFDADFPAEQQDSELPPFDQLAASLDGVSERDVRRFRELAVPQPGPVMRQVVQLTNDARRDVPSTIIACSFPSEVLMQMARAGNEMLAETASLRDLELVDLPTGHWPMWSRPDDLAAAISTAAVR